MGELVMATIATGAVGIVAVGGAVAVAVAVVGITGAVSVAAYKVHKSHEKARKAEFKKWKRQLLQQYPEYQQPKSLKIPALKSSHILDLKGSPGYSLGLGWNSVHEDKPINADLIAVGYDENHIPLFTVSGREGQLAFENIAMVHSGDCRQGGERLRGIDGHDDNENITINFGAMPLRVKSIVIGVIIDKDDVVNLDERVTNTYISGLPVNEFLSFAEYSEHKEEIQQRFHIALEKRPEINLAKAPLEPAREEDKIEESLDEEEQFFKEELESEKAFHYSIKHLNQSNAFIPGKFYRADDNAWKFVPIRVGCNADNIFELEKQMAGCVSDIRVYKHEKEFQIKAEPSDDTFMIKVLERDRFGSATTQENVTTFKPAYDNYIVFQWRVPLEKRAPVRITVKPHGDDEGLCVTVPVASDQVVARVTKNSPFAMKDRILTCSKLSYLQMVQKNISNQQEFLNMGEMRQIFGWQPQATYLQLTVVRGFELAAKDLNGKSDPYVRIYGKKNQESRSVKSQVIKKTLFPLWNFGVKVSPTSGPLKIRIFDQDRLIDEKIGSCSIDISKCNLPLDRLYLLKDGKKTKKVGAILVSIHPVQEVLPEPGMLDFD